MLTRLELDFLREQLLDVAQVNLIGGKNNIGKTSMLAAIYHKVRQANNSHFLTSGYPYSAADKAALGYIYKQTAQKDKLLALYELMKHFDYKLGDDDDLAKIPLKGFDLEHVVGGQLRFICIYCGIWASEGGVLCIDDIEQNLHFTAYDVLWRMLFEHSLAADCQVFATTHSLECIQAFNRVQLSNPLYAEKSGYLEIAWSRQRNRGPEQLEYCLNNKIAIRGE